MKNASARKLAYMFAATTMFKWTQPLPEPRPTIRLNFNLRGPVRPPMTTKGGAQ